MDSHLYVDQYLRRKRGVPFPATSAQQQQLSATAQNAILAAANLRHTTSPALAEPQAAQGASIGDFQRGLQEHADIVKDLAVNVNAFVERTDGLNLQVQTVEDKLLNLTKMLKVAQDISDEQNQSLAQQLGDIRKALQTVREDQSRSQVELADLRSMVPQMIREAVAAAKADSRIEIESVKASIQALEKSQLSMSNDLMTNFRVNAENMITARLQKEQERAAAALQEIELRIGRNISGLDKDFSARLNEKKSVLEAELQGLIATEMARRPVQEPISQETIRRIVEERIQTAATANRELQQAELRQTLLTVQTTTREDFSRNISRLEEELHDLNARVKHSEEHSNSIEGSFQEFIGAFKEHTAHQAARMEETAVHMRELMELHDETRSVVAAELEATKQWATRNMTRLKKHIDNANVDLTALKDAHRDLHQLVERMRLSQSDERSRLADLVEQRTREAAALSDMVDKEIASVQHIARTYRTSAHGRTSEPSTRAGGNRPRKSAGAGEEDSDKPSGVQSRESDDEDVFVDFVGRTAARRKRMQQLYADLKSGLEPSSELPRREA